MLFVEYFWNGHFETCGFASRDLFELWKVTFVVTPNICEITTVSNFRKADLYCIDLFGNKFMEVELAFYKGYVFCRGEYTMVAKCRVEDSLIIVYPHTFRFYWK